MKCFGKLKFNCDAFYVHEKGVEREKKFDMRLMNIHIIHSGVFAVSFCYNYITGRISIDLAFWEFCSSGHQNDEKLHFV